MTTRTTDPRTLSSCVWCVCVCVSGTRFIPALRLVIVAIRYPLPTLGYVILVVTMVMFVYTMAGVVLFERVQFSPPFSMFANFRHPSSAMQVLFVLWLLTSSANPAQGMSWCRIQNPVR
jgi:hypothetical protein